MLFFISIFLDQFLGYYELYAQLMIKLAEATSHYACEFATDHTISKDYQYRDDRLDLATTMKSYHRIKPVLHNLLHRKKLYYFVQFIIRYLVY